MLLLPDVSKDLLIGTVRAWRTIEAALPAALVSTLRPPATAASVRAAEHALGCPLPPSFAVSLAVHDGQRRNAPALVDGWRLLALHDAIEAWQVARRRSRQRRLSRHREPAPQPEVGVQPCWWHARWVPVAVHADGSLACVDLAPTVAGELGQLVVYHDHDPARWVLATGFTAWLGVHARVLARAAGAEVTATG